MPRKAATETATFRNCPRSHADSSKSQSPRLDASFLTSARRSSLLRQVSRIGSTVMTMSFGRSYVAATMGPPSFDFLLDVADDVAHLAPQDRLVQDPRAQELLDQALEPEAQRDDARDLADDLRLPLTPRPGDSADPRATPGLPERSDPLGTRGGDCDFEGGPPVPMSVEALQSYECGCRPAPLLENQSCCSPF